MNSIWPQLEPLLARVQKPARYIGCEDGAQRPDHEHGRVEWAIRDGLLVARGGHGSGFLSIDVRREGPETGEPAVLKVEVEVANFYPSISRLNRRVYDATQSRIHVIVTNRFLRSLQRLDLAESRIGSLRS